MSEFFDNLKKSVEKKVKGVHISYLSESEIATDRYFIKTPSLDLNRILSGSFYKGIQSRNLVGIVGPEHAFKSSFMVLCMAEAQKQGLKPIIFDTEGGITDVFCERWGMNPKEAMIVYTPFISEIHSTLAQIRESEEQKLIIGIDSVGGIDRVKALEDAVKGTPKADQGLLQKEIRSMLKLLLNICISQNSIGIACGHLYGSPGMIPMPDQIGGGKAMRLFPTVLINLKKSHIKEGTGAAADIIGNEIKATTLKNRIYPPFQSATININYREGIDPYSGILSIAEDIGVVVKKGAYYKTVDDETIGQGEAKAAKALANYPDIIKKLEEHIQKTGYSTFNAEVKQAEDLLESVEGTSKEEEEEVKVSFSKNFESMTGVQLKEECRKVGLVMSGKKPDLVKRLTEYYRNEAEEEAKAEEVKEGLPWVEE